VTDLWSNGAGKAGGEWLRRLTDEGVATDIGARGGTRAAYGPPYVIGDDFIEEVRATRPSQARRSSPGH
jgi:hypothetical protein